MFRRLSLELHSDLPGQQLLQIEKSAKLILRLRFAVGVTDSFTVVVVRSHLRLRLDVGGASKVGYIHVDEVEDFDSFENPFKQISHTNLFVAINGFGDKDITSASGCACAYNLIYETLT
ncbi:hypothetical protein MTR_3g436090 [Medicago truncatula]|uniref:Uncharacterized protein n=1 Tax=Medicago truncatula TaxID=3880 RepID=A0A072V591_MEDTR|nr:hypothetical protein MTR_3g436090 [Medicago truncatula]